MHAIQVLDNSMIDQIAAGEVVERPLSIVKELVENAIDAGSTAITVEIENGGLAMIRVTDNGGGIPKDQIKTAFMRHATSKIRNMDDLVNVMTMGFRGEALSSIASVAQVEIITKTNRELTGIRMEIHGGHEMGCHELGCAEGTTIIARNLFYNTPVRLRFMKKPSTEAGYISDIINKLALGHPEISFTYINGGSQILRTNGNGDLKTAIFYVYGKDISRKLITLEYKKTDFQLSGYIGKPEVARGNRSYGNFFINGRYVKSELLQSAVEEAYKTLLPGGKFPLYVLCLCLPPDNVDVNVHPNKLDIRFRDEKEVFLHCVEAVADTLRESNLVPEWEVGKYRSKKQSVVLDDKASEEGGINVVYGKRGNNIEALSVREEDVISIEKRMLPNEILRNLYPPKQDPEGFETEKLAEFPSSSASEQLSYVSGVEEPFVDKTPVFSQYKIIGQIFQTYWIVEQGESIYLIDQHAAHERALYEDLMKELKSNAIHAQQQLQPAVVHMSLSEKVTIMDHMELFARFGFEIEEFGEQALLVRAVPFVFKGPVSSAFFLEIVDRLQKVNTSVSDLYETKLNTIATIACKAAVKAHDTLTTQEAESLIKKILTLDNPFTCPHGRPTIIQMTRHEIEKKFKRV